MRAESLMALTNLTPDSDLDCLSPDPGILAVLTQMLLCAVRGQVSPPHPDSISMPILGWRRRGLSGLMAWLERQAWRDVAWYDADECLRPLARLIDNASNRAALVRLGLVAVLSEFLASSLVAAVSPRPLDACTPWGSGLDAVHSDPEGWTGVADSDVSRLLEKDVDLAWDLQAWGEGCPGGDRISSRSASEMGLAVEALAGLARDSHGRQRMCQARLPPLLRAVAAATRRSSCCPTTARSGEEVHRREGWVLRERHLAVAMGQVCCSTRLMRMRCSDVCCRLQHWRLGGSSCVLMSLDAPVLWMILEAASDTR
jgi:hypothetical protein